MRKCPCCGQPIPEPPPEREPQTTEELIQSIRRHVAIARMSPDLDPILDELERALSLVEAAK